MQCTWPTVTKTWSLLSNSGVQPRHAATLPPASNWYYANTTGSVTAAAAEAAATTSRQLSRMSDERIAKQQRTMISTNLGGADADVQRMAIASTSSECDGVGQKAPIGGYHGGESLFTTPGGASIPLTPVTRRPRPTHPGCTTIKYNRRSKSELDQRRVHFCNYGGMAPYMTCFFKNYICVYVCVCVFVCVCVCVRVTCL